MFLNVAQPHRTLIPWPSTNIALRLWAKAQVGPGKATVILRVDFILKRDPCQDPGGEGGRL